MPTYQTLYTNKWQTISSNKSKKYTPNSHNCQQKPHLMCGSHFQKNSPNWPLGLTYPPPIFKEGADPHPPPAGDLPPLRQSTGDPPPLLQSATPPPNQSLPPTSPQTDVDAIVAKVYDKIRSNPGRGLE